MAPPDTGPKPSPARSPSSGSFPSADWPLHELPVAAVVLAPDAHGAERIVALNAEAANALGVAADVGVGRRWDQLVRSAAPQSDPPRVQVGGTTGRWFDAPSRSIGDRRLVQLVASVRPVEAAEAEQELQNTIRDLRNIIDYSAALVYVKDLEGRYVLVNRYFERQFGVPREQILGLHDRDLFPLEAATAYAAHDRTVLETGTASEVEEPAMALGRGRAVPDPDARWLSIKFPLLDEQDQPYAIGGISTDITDRKRAEAAARAARDEAERADRAKSEFLSRMSHELRTPLNAILGFGQLLERSPLDADAAQGVARILGAGRHLLALIDEVLEISRIEAGHQEVVVAPIPACAPLEDALQLARPLAASRGIALGCDLHGGLLRHVLADHQRLEQALLNLLANAIKYNRDDGVVSVSIRSSATSLRYVVSDTGPGIATEDLERLFVPFERLGAERTETEGTGLGLALSRALVEAMGGSVGVQHTAPGEGSAFYVEVPTTDRPVAAAPLVERPARSPAAPLGRGTVLYVEDARSNTELVERVLAVHPEVALETATTGAAALAVIAAAVPDVVLLDLHLPDMSGLELLRRLRAAPETEAIPVVVLSADAIPANIERIQNEQISAYLTKPLDIDRLLDTLRPLLGDVAR